MKGGDINRALADALDYNNRLAATARGEAPAPPPPGGAPAAAAPAPTAAPAAAAPQAPPAAPAVALPDPATIERELTSLLDSDRECVDLAQTFRADLQRVTELDQKHGNEARLGEEIRYRERRMQDPDIKEDPVAQASLREEVRELKEVRAERRETVRHALEAEGAYNKRVDAYQTRINSRYEASRAQAESNQQVERHAQELSVSWAPAMQRAATAHNIPAELLPRFEKLARQTALANVETGFAIEDLPTFMEGVAKELIEIVDQGHRIRAGEYGDAARKRAEEPGPAGGAPVTTAQVQQPNDLSDVYKRAALSLRGQA